MEHLPDTLTLLGTAMILAILTVTGVALRRHDREAA